MYFKIWLLPSFWASISVTHSLLSIYFKRIFWFPECCACLSFIEITSVLPPPYLANFYLSSKSSEHNINHILLCVASVSEISFYNQKFYSFKFILKLSTYSILLFSGIQHLYTLLNDHHNKSSIHLALYSYYNITDYIPYAVIYIL